MWVSDLSLKFIPWLLKAEQRERHLPAASHLLERAQADENSFQNNVTGDETWVYSYNPETKRLSSQWKVSSSSFIL
jgi:hypothetical protein